jgi:hypothetical protein
VPAWLGLSLLLTFLEKDAWPLLRGGHPMNSFPHLAFSSRCFAIAFAWFAVVAAFWIWHLSGRIPASPGNAAREPSERDVY